MLPVEQTQVDDQIRRKLGDQALKEMLRHLARGDCQTCDQPIESGPVALHAKDLGEMVFIDTHHPACRRSAWADSGALTYASGVGISYRTLTMLMPLLMGAERDERPAMLVHPSLEFAVLDAEQGGQWRVSTVDAYAQAGLRPVGLQARIAEPVPGVEATLRGQTLTVTPRPGGPWTWTSQVAPITRQAIQERRGVLLYVSTLFDPEQMTDIQHLNTVFRAGQAMVGWIALTG